MAQYGKRALILYTVIGCSFDGNNWSWTLLTVDDAETQSKRISSDNLDLETPVLDINLGAFSIGKYRGYIVYQSAITRYITYEDTTSDMPKEGV